MLKGLLILAVISYSLQAEHCLSELKVCNACKSGFNFQYYSNTEVRCTDIAIAFCETMSSNKCQYCQAGYDLNEDQTQCNKIEVQYTIPNCLSEQTMNGNTICISCNKEYFPSEDRTSCVKFPHCKILDSTDSTKCSECYDYYYPNSNGQCEKSFCEYKDNDGSCAYCYGQFYLDDNDNCVKIPIAYCKYGDEEECSICMTGYTLSNDEKSCKPDTQTESDYCYEHEDIEAGTCTSCFEGYSLNAQKKCIENCASYTTIGCSLCEDNYISYDGINCEYIGSKSNSNNETGFLKFNLGLISLILFFI